MQFLSSLVSPSSRVNRPPLGLELMGTRVMLRMGDPTDWREWRAMREISRSFLVPWEPSWPHNALTYGYFCGLMRRHWRDWRLGRAYSFLIFTPGKNSKSGSLLGGITLNDIQRGVAQKGTLGYWIAEPHAGRGYMTEAANLVGDFAFETLRLHRLEASCLPHNEPSRKLLARIGFEEEGFARAYLQINGTWQDHLLWGKAKSIPS
jgi:ribosomal-protein-alanine N-acetyltransferase